MTQLDNEDLMVTLYKENLAEKIYLSDEENAKLLNGNPNEIPSDLFFEELKEGEEIVKKFFK